MSASLSLGGTPASAQNATWNNPATVAGPSPGTFDFNASANWNTSAVPTGTAFFNSSTTPNLSFSSGTTIGGWTFNAGASAYTFTNNQLLEFIGAGIVINGGSASLNGSGSINFRNASTAGSASIAPLAAFLQFYDSSTAGHAAITLNNDFLGFSNNSTAASASIVTTFASTLQFSNSSTAGNASITMNSNAHLSFLDTSTAGSAFIANNNLGTVQFANGSTAGNASIVNTNGTLNFTDTSTAGHASIANSALMQFSGLSTAGNASITSNGTVNFSNSGTAGGASITNNFILFFSNSSTAGSASITNNSFLAFENSSTAGGAAITNVGGSAVTDFSASTATNSAGSIAGSGNFYLGAAQLTVGGNNLSTTVSGVISDCGAGSDCLAFALGFFPITGGSLVKVATGTLTLSGANTYTGATTVDAGTLNVTGSIASSSLVNVNTGAILEGTGTVGNTSVNSGGTLAPGNGTPGSSMAVTANLAFQSGAQYLVQLNPAASSFANVTGTATLSGATVNAIYASGSYVSKQYTILKATGGVNGTFGSLINTNLPANIQTSLSYDASDVFLNLLLNFAVPTGLNGNQQNIGNALTNFFNSTGGIPMAFAKLSPAGLTQAADESASGSQQTTFDAMNLFLGLLTDPFMAGRVNSATGGAGATPFAGENDGANAYADNGKPRSNSERDAYAAIYRKAPVMADPVTRRWNVWSAGFGGSQTTNGNAALGSNTATSRVYGTAVGADYRFSPFTLAGFALAGGGTNFSIANGLGTGRSDLFQAGAFLRHTVGQAYISAALAYGWQDITTDRTVTIAGVDQLRASFNANAFSGRAEGGYRFVTPWVGGVGVTPYAAAQFTTFDLPAYAEQVLSGANTFALAYGSKSVTDTRSELGLRTDKSFALQNAILTLRGRVAWAHDFDPDRAIAATFQALPGASFVVNGAARANDSALTTASVETKWMNGWSAAATFEGEFSDVTRSYAGKGVVRYAW